MPARWDFASSNKGSGSRWQRYFDLLVAKDVPEKYRPRYARHVEVLVAAFPDRGLGSLSKEEIKGYLSP